MPIPAAGYCWPIHLQETLKHSQAGQAQSLVGGVTAPFPESWEHKFVCPLEESLVAMRFDFKVIAPLLPSCCSFSFVLGCGVSFFSEFHHSPIDD